MMEEHGEPVGGAAAGFGGGVEETSFGRAVDGVVDQEVRLEDAGGEDCRVGGAKAKGGGVDNEVDGVEFGGDGGFVQGKDFEAVVSAKELGGVKEGFEFGAEGFGFFGGAVGDDQAFAFFEGGLAGKGLTGSSGAEDEDAEVADIDVKDVADGPDPTIAVGVEADEAAGFVAEDGVDGAHGLGGVGEFVNEVGEGDFVGKGAVPTAEVEVAKGLNGGGELVRGNVDADVGSGQFAGGEGCQLHLGGEGVGDGVADDAITGLVGGEGGKFREGNDWKHAGSYRGVREKCNLRSGKG